MQLNGKSLSELTETDISALKDNGVPEGRSLDYKRELPRPEKLVEYRKDVCAFANSGGGFLIYGVDEEGGVPTTIPGVDIPDVDALIRQLDAAARDAIEPRLLGTSFNAVKWQDSKFVFVVEVAAGWNPPHMVKDNGRFYARNAAGQHPLDVQEIRRSVLASEGYKTDLARWRAERLTGIQGDEGPRKLGSGLKLVAHLAPVGQAELDPIDVAALAKKNDKAILIPIAGYHHNHTRYTVDGLLVHDGPSQSEEATAYSIIYRDGRIESVAGSHICVEKDGVPVYSPANVEPQIVQFLDRARAIYTAVGITRPWLLMVTLLNAKRLTLPTGWGPVVDKQYGCDRPTVMLPEVLIEGHLAPSDVLLRPVFNAMWNTCGFESCMNYGDDGRWTKKSV